MFAAGDQKARNQTFPLNGKSCYVRPGDAFKAGACFLSGTPTSLANLSVYLPQHYDPIADLASTEVVDRYAGVKALRFRPDLKSTALSSLEGLLKQESDSRVRLEAAASAAVYGSTFGKNVIEEFVWRDDVMADLKMEATFIVTELGLGKYSADLLQAIASSDSFGGIEIRQAAVWGLGKAGLRLYERLLPFVADSEENVALHAIAAFGNDTPSPVIDRLIDILATGDRVTSPAASEALLQIGSRAAVDALVHAFAKYPSSHDWLLATLGRLPPDLVRNTITDQSLLQQVEPMMLVAPGANWLSSQDMHMSMAFLRKQEL